MAKTNQVKQLVICDHAKAADCPIKAVKNCDHKGKHPQTKDCVGQLKCYLTEFDNTTIDVKCVPVDSK